MIKIGKQDYINFYDIFNELGFHGFLLSSLDGIVKGELYADDTKNPTYAIMLTADCYYVVGDLSDEQLEKEFFTLSQSDAFLDYTGIIFQNKNLSRIKEIFGKHTYEYIDRNGYKLFKSEVKYIDTIIDSADIIKLTPNNIVQFKEYRNFKEVYEECKRYWDEYPKSSKINFSIALVKDNTILSCCYLCGESSSENSCELGIDTFKGFRRKGYAETVCRETIKELIKLGYDNFNWHCYTDNIASSKTALKLGFKMVEESQLAWFRKVLDKK
ncbi:MAG: GNAT family N-acetyltransferase [Candidatus Delongbacteria bacterium]|nr:GNAT family N-acetyltransferase [Candidatus Delongbacteria bacterium]